MNFIYSGELRQQAVILFSGLSNANLDQMLACDICIQWLEGYWNNVGEEIQNFWTWEYRIESYEGLPIHC